MPLLHFFRQIRRLPGLLCLSGLIALAGFWQDLRSWFKMSDALARSADPVAAARPLAWLDVWAQDTQLMSPCSKKRGCSPCESPSCAELQRLYFRVVMATWSMSGKVWFSPHMPQMKV
ncbi:hypothetical protein [Uliginosibacterium sediminicola]|uniref:Uncharacterized protein n=1 Tax=Uliginosibacterium sediminicola TaxID=2024550 RepID=A0ABU9YUZ3_9RHOO